MKRITKVLPYYLIISGLTGLILVFYIFIKAQVYSTQSATLLLFPGLIYGHSIYAGLILKMLKAYSLENVIINQSFQVVVLSFWG